MYSGCEERGLKKTTGEWEGIYFMLDGVWHYKVFSYWLNIGVGKGFHCVSWMGQGEGEYKLVLQ